MRLGGRGGGWTCSGQKCNNRWIDGQISLPYPTSMALPFGREEVRVGIWGGGERRTEQCILFPCPLSLCII